GIEFLIQLMKIYSNSPKIHENAFMALTCLLTENKNKKIFFNNSEKNNNNNNLEFVIDRLRKFERMGKNENSYQVIFWIFNLIYEISSVQEIREFLTNSKNFSGRVNV